MKNTEIAMVILLATVSVVLSYFLGNAFLGDPNDQVKKVDYMDVVSSEVEQPDDETFNPKALNPTVEVYVGNCGPLEKWSPALKACVPKDEDKAKENDDTENNEGDEGEAIVNGSETPGVE